MTDATTSNDVTNRFHQQFYESSVWLNTCWLGIPVRKNPMDLWVYQELIHRLRPDVIVECGTAFGGSAFFFASICDLIKHGRIVTIDVLQNKLQLQQPRRPRITYLNGSSVDASVIQDVKSQLEGANTVMVVLDSNHEKDHVLQELRLYSEFVTPNSYLIVEDTNVNGHPVEPEHGAGPAEAVAEFLRERNDFISDASAEKFMLSFNCGGYLRRLEP